MILDPVRIGIAGAGLIGRRHAKAIGAVPGVELHAIADPSNEARAWAGDAGVRWCPSLDEMLADAPPDGMIVATPNALHVEHGRACVAARIPALIEKPLASDLTEGRALVEAGENTGVALLVGHHRRHNALVQHARQRILDGAIGRVAIVNGMFWVMKPDGYFDTSWRREPGGGPLLINLIHDIDLLRHLVGEIRSVRAVQSNRLRGNPVEDTAAILMQFENGALGAFTLSDTVVAPWSWELTARENAAYPATGQSCYTIGGDRGSMELPSGGIWRHTTERSWMTPISVEYHPAGSDDPLVAQILQFARVIRGEEPPLAPAREGLRTLEVIDAIKRAAESGEAVDL
ncbi:MAG: Gfo/Idh/MocA family oxidoreductase [Hoeflea sp.]|uniref:Gfo/Idh/MocA family protein n=1 Tax=Hoeflea sp. TaxID=1940281 RepID=UPI0032EAA8A9